MCEKCDALEKGEIPKCPICQLLTQLDAKGITDAKELFVAGVMAGHCLPAFVCAETCCDAHSEQAKKLCLGLDGPHFAPEIGAKLMAFESITRPLELKLANATLIAVEAKDGLPAMPMTPPAGGMVN